MTRRTYCTCGRPLTLIHPEDQFEPRRLVDIQQEPDGRTILIILPDIREWRHPDNTPACTPP